MRPGGPIKLTLGLPLLALLLVSCKGETTPEPRSASESSGRSELPRVIEYNRDESVQYAADLPEIGCEPESKYCHNGISDRLLEEEDVFANSFLADFQGEPACSGIKIHPFGGNIVPNIAAHELASQKEDH